MKNMGRIPVSLLAEFRDDDEDKTTPEPIYNPTALRYWQTLFQNIYKS
jgi:hypothetical protein